MDSSHKKAEPDSVLEKCSLYRNLLNLFNSKCSSAMETSHRTGSLPSLDVLHGE